MKFYETIEWIDEDDGKEEFACDTLEEAMKCHKHTIREFGGCSLFDARSSIVKDSKGKVYAKWENGNEK